MVANHVEVSFIFAIIVDTGCNIYILPKLGGLD